MAKQVVNLQNKWNIFHGYVKLPEYKPVTCRIYPIIDGICMGYLSALPTGIPKLTMFQQLVEAMER